MKENFAGYIGGRKFLITLLSQILGFLLMWYTKIDPGVYATITVATVGAYIAGNVIQKNIKDE